MFGFSRKPAETAAAFPLAAKDMLLTVGHFAGAGGEFYGPQHKKLAELWSWYEDSQYDDLKYDWLGAAFTSGTLAKALVPRADGVPPGFKSMNVPKLSERRPSTTQRSVGRVVDRFTSLLFGVDCHPATQCIGDEQTGYWLASFAATCRLWARMQVARAIGGAEGAVGVGLRAIEGEPRVEVFDPRFTRQFWLDKEAHILRAIEVRYQIPAYVKGPGGRRELAFYWDRRVVSGEADISYQPVWCALRDAQELEDGTYVQAGTGREPNWQALVDVERSTKHGLGFCPVVWIQNLPSHDSEYGKPDCKGLYPQAHNIDQLGSQIDRAMKENLDPTLMITSPEGGIPENLRKGSGAGIGLKNGSTAQYLEAAFGSVSVAMQWHEKRQDAFFKEADCAELSKDGEAAQTATEIRAKLGPQQSKTALLREQYGQQGVRRILQMAVRMQRAMESRGEGFTAMEPRVVKVQKGEDKVEPVRLGPGGYIDVAWPPISRPGVADTAQAATAATTAKQGGVLDQETAVRYVASYFGADDVNAVLERVQEEKEEAEKKQAEQFAPPAPPEAQ